MTSLWVCALVDNFQARSSQQSLFKSGGCLVESVHLDIVSIKRSRSTRAGAALQALHAAKQTNLGLGLLLLLLERVGSSTSLEAGRNGRSLGLAGATDRQLLAILGRLVLIEEGIGLAARARHAASRGAVAVVHTLGVSHAARSREAGLLGATKALGQGGLALHTATTLHHGRLSGLHLRLLHSSLGSGGALEEGGGSKSDTLVTVNNGCALVGVEHGDVRLQRGSGHAVVGGGISVIHTHKGLVIGALVQGTGAAHRHVDRVHREGRHGGVTVGGLVARRVDGIVGTGVMNWNKSFSR